MTVGELIKHLRDFPETMELAVSDGAQYIPIRDVGPSGDERSQERFFLIYADEMFVNPDGSAPKK